MSIQVNYPGDLASLKLLAKKCGNGDYRDHLKQLAISDRDNQNRARRAAKSHPVVPPFPKTLGGFRFRHD